MLCRNPWSRVGPRPGLGHNWALSGTGWSWTPSNTRLNDPNTWGECDAVALGVKETPDLDEVTVALYLVLDGVRFHPVTQLNDPITWGECDAVALGVE